MFKRIFFILSGVLQSNLLKLIFMYGSFSHIYKGDSYFFLPQLISGNFGFPNRQNDLILELFKYIYIYICVCVCV